jgi:carnitine O-acetyltransferase
MSTFGNEDRLPRVPLYPLADSCQWFLDWCTPLLTADELAATRAAVDEFLSLGSPAHKLQAALESFNEQEGVRSWLDLFWPTRYLGRRDRIALNANFFFLFQDTDQTQEERAAALVTAAVDYKLRLDTESVPPIIQRGQPTTMEQNKFLFSTTRIPQPQQDTVRAPYSASEPGPSSARHIVVFFRGNAFRLDVFALDDRPYSRSDIADGLREIMRTEPAEISVGHLTTKARAEWAASRQTLISSHPGNAAALDTIETALFCLSLEDFAPADTLAACDQLLHGDSGNRWFDKAVTFIVFADGRAGINVEHCGLDGTTILSFVDTVLGAQTGDGSASAPPAFEPIEFVLTDELVADVRAAASSFAQYAADTATTTLSFTDFGSNTAKRLGVSPDGFVQMAYQLAHNRSKGLIGATYESIATRQYQNGRTEAMRVVTPEVLAFVSTMDDPAADASARRAAFRAAADKHVSRAKECQAGRAPEQHLWELQLIQRRRGAELDATEPLALYDSPGWLIMRDDYLSTSSAPSVNIQYFGFGATSNKCIGVAYVLLPDRFNIYLSTPSAVAAEMDKFAAELTKAMAELEKLLSEEVR